MPNLRVHDRCGCGAARGEHAVFSSLREAGGSARPFAFAGTPRNFERDRPFAIDHLSADIALDVAKHAIKATAELTVRRIDKTATEIDLDAVGFTIASVKVDGKPAEYRYDGRVLGVTLGKTVERATIAVAYAATPRRGLYFLEPDEHVPDRPRQVWSQCQEEDARHWLPCHDKPHVKMTTAITVTPPAGWSVLGNGELEKKGNAFTWTMKEPHPSYLITLVAGEFSILEDEADGVPLTYWIPKGREKDGKRTFEKTPEMIRHFGKLFGVKYPWNKYAQVVVSDFIFGGMENTTATTLYEHTLLDDRAAIDITSDDLIAHELAHQWFGDYVTCRDWSEGWLNEGFATFMEHMWREKDLGRDEYEFGLLGDLEGYTSEAGGRYRRPIVCQDYDAPLDLFDRHLYEKGGLVLHLLRTELGDEVFWRGIRDYLEAHKMGIVETRDLMRALEAASGKSLGRFFEQWVYKPGHAELDVAISWDDGILACEVKQTHHVADGVPNTFELPLWIDVDGERRKLNVTQRTEVFALPVPARPKVVVVDPDMRVLGEVSVKAPGDMLRNQLKHGKSARARYLASHALARIDDPPTIEALAERLRDEKEFWGTRAEVAAALAKLRSPEAYAVLAPLAKTKHPKVRRAIAAALGSFRSVDALEALKPLALGDESYMVQADAARSIGKTKQHAALDVLLDVVDRKSWADVVSVGALDGIAAMRDDRGVPHVTTRTRYGHPTRARRAAILALPKIADARRARETLEDLLDDKDPYLRVDVVRALADLGDPKARPALRTKLDTDLDPRVRRRIREALRDLGGEGKRAAEQLREELDRLRSEHLELKSRVSKLEARHTKTSETKSSKKKEALNVATAVYSIALLASAFLLFCIEPLVAKMLLPVSGGVPAVWSTCLVFFQVTLLAGYAFSNATLARVRPRVQALVYVVLFPAALVSLPIVIPHRELGAFPALSVLAMLASTVAVPFFVLSTLAPALQRWFSATGAAHAADPYFLYAASNGGSLVALAAYPILIEPASDLGAQSRGLRVAFVVLAVLVAACALMMPAGKDAAVSEKRADDAPPIAWSRRARWIVLAAIPSAQLVAVTSHVTTTVAPAPLLWAVPLAAYLASFVLVFARRPIPHAFVTRRLPFVVTVGIILLVTGANHPEWVVIALHVIVLLGVASFCHGAIAEDRPPAARLPEFYMWMSVGGAIGGAAAALGAPLLLKQPVEYPLCLLFALACLPRTEKAPRWARVLTPAAVLVAIVGDVVFARATGRVESAVAIAPVLVAFALDRFPRLMTWALAGVVLVHSSSEDVRGHVLVRERSFFGAFSVVRIGDETALKHGNTIHGLQLASQPRTATVCFSADGPIGDVIAMMHDHDRLHAAAVIGLGAGTLATFAHADERWRFFELDPAVIRIAKDPRYFTFLSDAFGATSDVVAGDARIELAKDPGGYDLLVVDAFTSDSIPTHLLTREALAMYKTKLRPGAFVAWNITNRYLDLKAVLAALADDAHLALLSRDDGAISPERLARGVAPSLWVVMTESADDLVELRAKHWSDVPRRPNFRPWSDERASIVTVWR